MRQSRIRVAGFYRFDEWDLAADVALDDDVLLLPNHKYRIVYGDELSWARLLALYIYWPERSDYYGTTLHTDVPWDFEIDSLGGHLLLIASEMWARPLRAIVAASSLGRNWGKPGKKTASTERVGSIREKPFYTAVDTIVKPRKRSGS